MTTKTILTGAISGFVSALLIDLQAYSSAPDGQAFNWGKAAARWVAGAISGAMTAAGIGLVA